MPLRAIQSVEVSFFVHCTEDREKVTDAIMSGLDIRDEPQEELLEGHFGNPILHMRWHLLADDAWAAFRALGDRLGTEEKRELLRSLRDHVDEHGALYVRLSKQALLRGGVLIAGSDPVRVRVKPRAFMLKGDVQNFYERLLVKDFR